MVRRKHLTIYERELAAMRLDSREGGYATYHMMKGLAGNSGFVRAGGFDNRSAVMFKPPKLWKEEPLAARDIRRISILPTRTKKLKVFSFADELIRIEATDGRVFDYLRSEEWRHFDEYRRGLKRFARENGVTFVDGTR